jgi:hypothetical protein
MNWSRLIISKFAEALLIAELMANKSGRTKTKEPPPVQGRGLSDCPPRIRRDVRDLLLHLLTTRAEAHGDSNCQR